MNVRGQRVIALACLAITTACGRTGPDNTATSSTVDPYRAEIEKFRQQREAKLTSDTGWLTIAGLYFLTKPETTVGSGGDNDVVLPAGAPPRVGTFVLGKDGRVSVTLEPGVKPMLLD